MPIPKNLFNVLYCLQSVGTYERRCVIIVSKVPSFLQLNEQGCE